MSALMVFASDGGHRYHSTATCPALLSAQNLSDWDCPDDYCRHDHPQVHPALDFGIAEMVESGRTPCRVCTPPLALTESFGHHPEWINQGYCGGCPNCGAAEEMEICVRCTQQSRRNIPWPCTTAVVLGLPTPA